MWLNYIGPSVDLVYDLTTQPMLSRYFVPTVETNAATPMTPRFSASPSTLVWKLRVGLQGVVFQILYRDQRCEFTPDKQRFGELFDGVYNWGSKKCSNIFLEGCVWMVFFRKVSNGRSDPGFELQSGSWLNVGLYIPSTPFFFPMRLEFSPSASPMFFFHVEVVWGCFRIF